MFDPVFAFSLFVSSMVVTSVYDGTLSKKARLKRRKRAVVQGLMKECDKISKEANFPDIGVDVHLYKDTYARAPRVETSIRINYESIISFTHTYAYGKEDATHHIPNNAGLTDDLLVPFLEQVLEKIVELPESYKQRRINAKPAYLTRIQEIVAPGAVKQTANTLAQKWSSKL